MSFEERLFLYALVRGTAPQAGPSRSAPPRAGSAAIFASALEANGSGPRGRASTRSRASSSPTSVFHGRFHLVDRRVTGLDRAEAARIAGGPFDLVLIDGMHIYQQAADDVAGALPDMAEQGYLLFHDSFHFGVSEAIREAIEADPTLARLRLRVRPAPPGRGPAHPRRLPPGAPGRADRRRRGDREAGLGRGRPAAAARPRSAQPRHLLLRVRRALRDCRPRDTHQPTSTPSCAATATRSRSVPAGRGRRVSPARRCSGACRARRTRR